MPLIEAATEKDNALLEFEQVQPGMSFSSARVFSAADLDLFAQLSGDYNPLHTSCSAAQEDGFSDRIVYGFLVASLLSGISGGAFQHAVCAAVSLDFVQPVFPGDRIDASAEVAHIQPAMRSVGLKVRITRGEDLIARGKLTTKFL